MHLTVLYAVIMLINNLMVVAPHPDDETIGAGGLISKVNRQGGKVTVVCVTCPNDTRASELATAVDMLGGADLRILTQFPTRWLDDRPLVDLVRPMENILDEIRPTALVMPSPMSFHQEHRATANAVLAATRPSGSTGRHRPDLIACYEEIPDYWSLTGDSPRVNWFVELSGDMLADKTSAMKAHQSQDRPSPSERSYHALHSLATMRGAQAGTQYAEAYEVRLWRS
jgi:LmbE family N-acetylglucosaminyl deacetylase